MTRPRHPDKDLEDICQMAEAHGWTLTRARKYFSGRCGCGTHRKTIHITPNGSYGRNLLAWFERQECWNNGGER